MLLIASTNRSGSVSLQLTEYLAQRLEELGDTPEILSLTELPVDFLESCLYTNSGKNAAFNELLDKVTQNEKLIFVIPEYNGSFPGVLKTFVDGLRFPEGVRDKKAALVGISSGNQGCALGMSHFTDILHYLGCAVMPTKTRIPFIEKNFVNGTIVDSSVDKILENQLRAFLKF